MLKQNFNTSIKTEPETKADWLLEVLDEYDQASRQHKPFNSAHEGFSILLEEVEELKAHVWVKRQNRDISEMRKEAVQVAAMALRFINDCCDE